MKDIPHELIIVLFVVAVVVTIAGSVVSLNKLSLSEDYQFITGAATSSGTGEANLTITSTTSITNHNFTLDFGSGYVNASCDYCVMDSNNVNLSMYSNSSNIGGDAGRCCVGFTRVINGFLLENTGNENISVGYTCSGNCTHALFLGGTIAAEMGGLEIKATANSVASQGGETGGTDSAASCTGGGDYYYGMVGWNITNESAYGNEASNDGIAAATYTSLSSVGHWLCGNATQYPLSPDNTKDAAVVDINITIPATATPTGVETSFTLTFNATSAG